MRYVSLVQQWAINDANVNVVEAVDAPTAYNQIKLTTAGLPKREILIFPVDKIDDVIKDLQKIKEQEENNIA